MTQLALIETDPVTGHITVVYNMGDCDQAGYIAQMRELVGCRNDWDTFCNTILNTLTQTGILREDGFSAAGYTYNDVLRAINDYAHQARDAARDTREKQGRSYEPSKFEEFLLGTDGMLVLGIMRGLAKIGKKGHDIVIQKDQAEAVFSQLLEPIRRQLIRDPERWQQIGPIYTHYFGAPDGLPQG